MLDSKIRIFLPQAMEHGVNCYGNKGPEYLSYQFITYYAGMELAETIIPGEKRHGLIKYPLDTVALTEKNKPQSMRVSF